MFSKHSDLTVIQSIRTSDASSLPPDPSTVESGRAWNRKDPHMFSNGLKTEDELSELRRRKRGHKLERYHRRQNEVCVLGWSLLEQRFLLINVD